MRRGQARTFNWILLFVNLQIYTQERSQSRAHGHMVKKQRAYKKRRRNVRSLSNKEINVPPTQALPLAEIYNASISSRAVVSLLLPKILISLKTGEHLQAWQCAAKCAFPLSPSVSGGFAERYIPCKLSVESSCYKFQNDILYFFFIGRTLASH